MKILTEISHRLVRYFGIEEVFARLGAYHDFFTKFIPLPEAYREADPVVVKRNEVNYELERGDYMQWHVFANLPDHSWKFALPFISPGDTILDVGANIGAFSLALAQAIKGCSLHNVKIIAFEPNPLIASQFRKNLSLNPLISKGVQLIELGLGDESATLPIVIDSQNTGGARFSSDMKANNKVMKARVERLDDWLATNPIDCISFLKVDIEGYEPLFLEGASETIKKFRPAIYIEMTEEWFVEKGCSTSEIINWLLNLGYDLYVDWKNRLVPFSSVQGQLKTVNQYNLLAKPGK